MPTVAEIKAALDQKNKDAGSAAIHKDPGTKPTFLKGKSTSQKNDKPDSTPAWQKPQLKPVQQQQEPAFTVQAPSPEGGNVVPQQGMNNTGRNDLFLPTAPAAGTAQGGRSVQDLQAECEQHKHAAHELAKAAQIAKQEVDALRQQLEARGPQQGGPNLYALQRELAMLEEANQNLVAQLDATRTLPTHTATSYSELQAKDAEMRRAQATVVMRDKEVGRLREELELAQAGRRDASMAAAMLQNKVNDLVSRLEIAEYSSRGISDPGLMQMLQRAQALEREKAENEQAMRELITETNGKAKTIADLLALQEDMVAELDSMRHDLMRMAQEKEALQNEKHVLEDTVKRYHAMGIQKEALEAEKQQLEEALQRYQEAGFQEINAEDRRMMEEAFNQLQVLQHEKVQLEDALRRYEGVDVQIQELQAENRQVHLDFERYRAEAEDIMRHTSSLPGPSDNWRQQAQKQEEEIARLQRLLSEQSKAMFSGVVSPVNKPKALDRDADLYALRDQVMALDRNLSPAVRDLQKKVIQQRERDDRNADKQAALERHAALSRAHNAGGSTPPQSSGKYDLRSTMPDSMPSYRDYGFSDAAHTDRDLYGTASSLGPSSLHASLTGRERHPLTSSQTIPLSASQALSQIAHSPSSSSAPPIQPDQSVDAMRPSHGSPPLGSMVSSSLGQTHYISENSALARATSSPESFMAGIRLGLPADIVNYKPPTSRGKSLGGLETQPVSASSSLQHNLYSTSVTPSSALGRAVAAAPIIPRAMTPDQKGALISTGMSPSQYVNLLKSGSSAQAPATSTPDRGPPPQLAPFPPKIAAPPQQIGHHFQVAPIQQQQQFAPPQQQTGHQSQLAPIQQQQQQPRVVPQQLQAPNHHVDKLVPGTNLTESRQAQQPPPPPADRSFVGMEHIDQDDMTQERMERFARFQQELLNTPAENWEDGLSEVQMTADGQIIQAPISNRQSILPGIQEEFEGGPDDSADRISRLEI